MKAAAHTAPGRITLLEWPTPSIGPGELLLRVRGCGVCGSDLARWRGGTERPAVLGHEVVGEVVAMGEGMGTPPFAEGDRVVAAHHVPCQECHYCRRQSPSMCRTFKASNLDPGGFAELIRVPAPNVRFATFRVPDGMPDEVAVFTEPLACCLRAVRRLGLLPGDTVAILGLGSIGCLLVQLVRRAGARVLGVDPLPDRQTLAVRLGADGAVPPEAVAEQIAAATEGRGADRVVLAVADPGLVAKALDWVRDGGAIHLFAGEGEAVLPVGALYHRELTLTATYSASPQDLAEAFALLGEGAVRVAELVSHRIPLERLQEAVGLLHRREALKVFVEVRP